MTAPDGKRYLIRIGLIVALLACSVVAVAHDLLDLRNVATVSGDAQRGKTKAAVCSGCHGPVGVALVPAFPSLAGQKAEYLYWRLVTFKRVGKPESPMTAQVANLDDAAMQDLAVYFAGLPASTATARAPESNARGAALYHEGDPARGIPPCQGCHGSTADGHPLAGDNARWRVYPALRGQHAAYIAQRLKDLVDNANPPTSSAHVMAPIARTLDADSIATIAGWLESGAPESVR
jgi:cytochrome c553